MPTPCLLLSGIIDQDDIISIGTLKHEWDIPIYLTHTFTIPSNILKLERCFQFQTYWHEYHRSRQNFLKELLIMNVITYLPHSYIQCSVEKSTGVVIPTVSVELPSSWRYPISGHRKLETIRYDGDHVLK